MVYKILSFCILLTTLSFAGKSRNVIVDKVWYFRQNTGIEANVTESNSGVDDKAGEVFFKLQCNRSGSSHDQEGKYFIIKGDDPAKTELFSILLSSSMNNLPVEVWYFEESGEQIVTRLFFWPEGYPLEDGNQLPHTPDVTQIP